uniref:Uncharacterized protein n=1 Tax=Photinus pyralis TaxID=7054 RepID=A0A1Y1KWV3_PHOPY
MISVVIVTCHLKTIVIKSHSFAMLLVSKRMIEDCVTSSIILLTASGLSGGCGFVNSAMSCGEISTDMILFSTVIQCKASATPSRLILAPCLQKHQHKSESHSFVDCGV